MHYTSLVLYDKYWRLGYYDGIKMEDFMKYAVKNQGKSHLESGIWVWVEDSKLKWEMDWQGVPIPVVDDHVTKDICHGFMWATVINKGTLDEFIKEQQDKRNVL